MIDTCAKATPAPAAASRRESLLAGLHVMLVAAHPDDEILGAGAQLAHCHRLSLVHLTDGVPSRRAARAHGFTDRRSYAEAREAELSAALERALAGAAPRPAVDRFRLGLPDGQSSGAIPRAITELAALLGRLRPDLVLTHPYEGGHPDHDTAAFATRRALGRAGLDVPLWEMTSYHAAGGVPVLGDFVPLAGSTVFSFPLTDAEQTRKRSVLDCFTSQRRVLNRFPVAVERFRIAPAYDFLAPPHPGRLLYENRRRALRSVQWRRLAAQADSTAPAAPATLWHRLAGVLFWRIWLAS